jgi:hypothetical protein
MKMSKTSWIGTVIAALDIAALFALNAYVLDLTRGCYNLITLLF